MDLLLILLCFLHMWPAHAKGCCGYAVAHANGEPWLFTDVVETDFTRIKSIASAADWQRQQFNVSSEAGRGKYSKMFTPNNVDVPSAKGSGRHAGVELSVGSDIVNGAVPVAEMDSVRQDIYWGSFRASIKMTAVKGTCAAFFWVGARVQYSTGLTRDSISTTRKRLTWSFCL